MSQIELRLTGSGGQGIILASVILAEAAVLSGKYTAQSQSYGPEARGGSCKAETIISDEPIGFTKVQSPSLFLALTREAYEKYERALPLSCTIIVDESVPIAPETISKAHNILQLPILRTAKEKVGRAQTANIVAVGCINSLLKLTDPKHMKKAVLLHVPKGTEELNTKALKEGEKLIHENS